MTANLNHFSALDQLGHPIQQTVLTIVKEENGKMTPLGTGFIISDDGLMISAKHVTDEIKNPNTAGLYGLYIRSETEGGLWPIDYIWGNAGLDIVFMYLRPAFEDGSRIKHKTIRLSLQPPPIGTPVWGFGYHGMTGKIVKGSEAEIREIRQNTGITIGEMVEIFEKKRDSSFLRFPCFQTNCKFVHGMSGGPIFRSDTNEICGVVCSGYDDTIDNEGFISYGSTLWPSLGISTLVSLDGERAREYSILEIAQRGAILTDSTLEKVIIHDGRIFLKR